MVEQTHTLHLKLDASQAASGAKTFSAAIAAVKNAVKDLERNADGTFAKLNKVDVSRLTTAEAAIRRTSTEANTLSKALASTGTAAAKSGSASERAYLAASMALRQATTSAQKLAFRLDDLGDAKGLDRLDEAVDRLHAQLRRPLDVAGVRLARNEYENLRTELTQAATAAEYAKGAQAQLAREAREAATAADQHAAANERLRRELVPLYAASKDYEAQLERITQAERESVITTGQAEAARDRAAQSLLTAGRNADTFAGQMRGGAHAAQQVGFQLNDIGVMLAGGMSPLAIATGQGTQLAQTFATLGSRAEVLSTLKAGFLSMVSPISLVTIGAIAMGAALYYGLQKVIPQAKSLEDALKDLDAAMGNAKSTATEASDLDALTKKYAGAASEVRALANAKRDLARMDAEKAFKDAKSSFSTDVGFNKWWDSLRGFAGNESGRIAKLAHDFDLTTEAATRLNEQLYKAQTSTTAEGAATFYGQMRQTIVDAAGGMDKLTAAQSEVVKKINEMEGKAREFGALDMAKPVAEAKTSTDAWIGSMQSLQGAAQGVMNTLQALAGIKINISAPTITAPTLPKATPVKARPGMLGKITNVQNVSYQPDATAPAADMTTGQLQAVITASVQRNAALKVEGATAKDLNSTMRDRLSALAAERVALIAVASGMYDSEEGARLYAESMVAEKGAVDATTLSLIAQVDAANSANEAMTRAAKDPVKELLKATPTWTEAGKQAQAGMAEGFSSTLAQSLKSGDFDLEAFGDALFAPIADQIAQKATAELMNLFGGDNGGLLGGLFDSLGFASLGDPDIAAMQTGGTQAGTAISSAMVQAGQQVSQSIAAAMTGAGSQAGAAVRSGVQTGGVVAGTNIRTAGTQAGTTLGQGVVQGAQQGAPILASGVASGAAGGGMAGGAGGGILSGLGGWQGLLSMALGAFSEGGMSNSPVGFASAPISAFRNAPHFAQGTPNTSGIPAVLHDNEAVIPLSKGRKIGVELNGDSAGGGGTVVQNMSFTFPNADVESFRRSKSQVAADMQAAGARAAQKNR